MTINGELKYEIILTDKSYKIALEPDRSEQKSMEDDLACILSVLVITKNTLAHMKDVKERDRPMWNRLYKKSQHEWMQFERDLNKICEYVGGSLEDYYKSNIESKTTIQNETINK